MTRLEDMIAAVQDDLEANVISFKRMVKSRVALHVGQEGSTELESFFSLIGICSGYSSIIWYIRRRVI
jgi:hypothetical protein